MNDNKNFGYLGYNFQLKLLNLIITDNMFFQSIGGLWGTGSAHHDHTSKYTVLTFLNLRYPSNSGIEIYNERTTEDHSRGNSFESTKVNFYLSGKNPIERFFFVKKLDHLTLNWYSKILIFLFVHI